jgi:hypothetical protein
MSSIAVVLAEVTFLPQSEGGRAEIPKLTGCGYWPHIVIGDPQQRSAIIDGHQITEHYLGVAFLSGPEVAPAGVPVEVELALIYPGENYDAVAPGATFTIREGPRVVGYGRVLSLPVERALPLVPGAT